MATKRKDFGGKPKREPRPGERVHAGLRLTPEAKGRIERAAQRSGRSLSQEMEFRLERSFSLDTAFGSGEMLDMALKMATAFAIAGNARAVEKGIAHWLDDADCYRSAMLSVFSMLLRGQPNGDEASTALAIEALKSSHLTWLAQQGSR